MFLHALARAHICTWRIPAGLTALSMAAMAAIKSAAAALHSGNGHAPGPEVDLTSLSKSSHKGSALSSHCKAREDALCAHAYTFRGVHSFSHVGVDGMARFWAQVGPTMCAQHFQAVKHSCRPPGQQPCPPAAGCSQCMCCPTPTLACARPCAEQPLVPRM